MSTAARLATDLSLRITDLCAAPDRDWSAPSPCDGWSTADVLSHVVDSERDFLATHEVDLPALTADEPLPRWREHAGQLAKALDDPALTDHAFDGYFGPTTVGEAFVDFYAFDLVVHRWDLARAFGTDTTFSHDELDLVEHSIAAFGPAMHQPGICDDRVDVPADATRQQRLLAVTGRTAD